MKPPLTAIILTRNELAAIERCVQAASFCDQVIVVDSHSDDGTAQLALALDVDLVQFVWDGKYPKKKQWALELPHIRNDWVLLLDADEVVSPALQDEITLLFGGGPKCDAYDIPLEYVFLGQPLRFGHRVTKRSLLNRQMCRFPEVGDLAAPGITEVEGHYQPVSRSKRYASMRSPLIHDDPDPIGDWVSRHNRYSDWEAYLAVNPAIRASVRDHRSRGGQIFDRLPAKPIIFFFWCFVLRRGFLDGRAGFAYAISLAWYYWLTEIKVSELRRKGANAQAMGE